MRVDIEAVLARSLNLIIKPLSVRHLMYLSYPLRGMLRVSFIWDVMLHCTMGGPIMGGKHICRDGILWSGRRTHACPFRKSYPDVLVVQSSQDRNADDSARSLDGSMRGRIFLYCQVRAHLIVIRRIRGKNSPQVRLAEDEHLIQALAAQCADQTFCTAILPR